MLLGVLRACVLGFVVAAGAASGMVRWLFDRSPWVESKEPELRQFLVTALQRKFGEPSSEFVAELQGRQEPQMRAILEAVETAQDLDELRKML